MWDSEFTYEQWTEAVIGETRISLSYWAKKRTGEDGYFVQYLEDIMEYYQ